MKTHMCEADHRSTPLRILCTTATNAISELAELSRVGGIDGLTAMEYAEYQHGAVLVACQAYAVGTVGDLNKCRESLGLSPLKKLTLYRSNEANLPHTHVEQINALANLFKHRDEWENWPTNETTRVMRYFGILESTEFPLDAGIRSIIGESSDLRRMAEVLEGWRFMQFQHWYYDVLPV